MAMAGSEHLHTACCQDTCVILARYGGNEGELGYTTGVLRMRR